MSENMAIVLITIGGLVCMSEVSFKFIKIMINTTKKDLNREHNSDE